jgi:purine-binding chemotaxis protein CheW
MAQTTQNQTQLDELLLVVFTIGNEEFGVDIGRVLEIIKMTEITIVPDVPEYVNGIINLRGKIVTVIDLKKKLRMGERKETADTRIMIVDVHENTLGMIVDSVKEVLRLNKKLVNPTPKDLATKIHDDFIQGVGNFDKRLIILLNLEGVLLREDVDKVTQKTEKTA